MIIPGFGGNKNMEVYRKFRKIFGKSCYIFSPTWNYKTIKYWLKEYEEFIVKNKITNFTAIGFSMGAYIIACSNILPKNIIYASMSPLFKEDINNWPKKMIQEIGKRRIKTLGTYHKKPNSIFIYGENEVPFMKKMIDRLSGKNRIILIKGVGHDISVNKYFDTIVHLISQQKK